MGRKNRDFTVIVSTRGNTNSLGIYGATIIFLALSSTDVTINPAFVVKINL